MFNKMKDKIAQVTILSKGLNLVGDINSSSDIRIEGNVTGAINALGKIIIDHGSTVIGPISGQDIDIFGNFEGDIIAKQSLLIGGNANVKGNISCKEIEIQKGSKVEIILNSKKENLLPKPIEAYKEVNVVPISEPRKIAFENIINQKTSFIESEAGQENVIKTQYGNYW
jgi:cytoskeletal protein CcmA (bactofilin family)